MGGIRLQVETSLPEQATRHTAGGAVLKSVYTATLRGLRNPVAPRLFGLLARPGSSRAALAAGEWLVRRHRRVLALSAHADDLEFFCGGTLRRLHEAGAHVTAVILSDGEKGGNLRNLGDIRLSEEGRAAAVLGYDRLLFGHLPDYGFPQDPRLAPTIERAWDEVRPDLVLAFDPRGLEPGFVNKDHTTLGRVTIKVARRRLAGGARVCFYATRHPNVLVNIDAVEATKERAVLSHRSQLRFLPVGDYPNLTRLYGRIFAAWAPCRYAEPIYRLL